MMIFNQFSELCGIASFFLSILLIPLYVALSTHHYHMFPLQILYVLIESRSKVPFSPFWEAVLMRLVIEIIKEASVRMPTRPARRIIFGGVKKVKKRDRRM